jgi:hypothetical protein
MEMSSEAVRKRVARSVEKFRKVYGKKIPSVRDQKYENSINITKKV